MGPEAYNLYGTGHDLEKETAYILIRPDTHGGITIKIRYSYHSLNSLSDSVESFGTLPISAVTTSIFV